MQNRARVRQDYLYMICMDNSFSDESIESLQIIAVPPYAEQGQEQSE